MNETTSPAGSVDPIPGVKPSFFKMKKYRILGFALIFVMFLIYIIYFIVDTIKKAEENMFANIEYKMAVNLAIKNKQNDYLDSIGLFEKEQGEI